jgi:hypothetical protein
MRHTFVRLTTTTLFFVFALGCTPVADSNVTRQVIPDTPDGTVLAVAEALRNNQPEILWSALPESYRRDINEITRTFSEKMDAAVYDRAFALVMRAGEVLDDRKEIILASETFRSVNADAGEIREALSNTRVFLETLKTSEIATLQGLGQVDWERFLATTGGTLIEKAAAIERADGGHPFEKLDSLEVKVLEIADDRAKLQINSADHQPQEVDMARVEGRWIPAEMADDWPRFVDEARSAFAEMTPENMAAQKTQIMMFLGMADGFIEQVALLETPEEFDAAIGGILAPFMGGAAMGEGDDAEMEMPEDAPEEE